MNIRRFVSGKILAWVFVVLIVGPLFVSVASVSADEGTLFEDDFGELNLNNWSPFGSPSPRVLASVEGRTGVFDNNGDGWCDSGAVSIDTFPLSNGFTMGSDVFVRVTNQQGCWNAVVMGLTKENTPYWDHPNCPGEGYYTGLAFGIVYVGDACWAAPSDKRRHAYFSISLYTEDGVGEGPGGYAKNADDYIDGWHNLKIVVGEDRFVSFYCDDILIYKSEKRIHEDILQNKKIYLGQRSSGSAGKAYHDNINVYAGGSNDGLVAEWHFDEGSGDTVADSSGNGNDGIIQGATWTTGVSGTALEFDGTSDYIQFETPVCNDPPYSVEVWVKPTTTSPERQVCAISNGGETGASYGFCLVLDNDLGGWIFGVRDSSGIRGGPSTPATSTGWTHLVGVWDGSTSDDSIKLYVNGELVDTFTPVQDESATESNLKIGAYGAYLDYFFSGIIDEVAIYSRTLTADEIKAHYEEENPGELPDLTLSPEDISFTNPNPTVGETVTITARIHNIGNADANDVIGQFFDGNPVNGTQIGTNQAIDLIIAGENGTVSVTWIAGTCNHDIYVKIDPDGSIEESNENNNEAHMFIEVGGCTKDIIAQKILLLHLNHFWNYDFYEKYYEYDDNATAPDPTKDPVGCTIPIEDDDIWITHFSLTSPGFYPSSAALMGPVIGFDTNAWYNWGTPVNGITYPEFEIKGIDEWISDMPFVGEDVKELLEGLLDAAEFYIKLDGVYADAPIEWEPTTNRSSIPVKFSGRAIGPGLEEGGECGGTYVKNYYIDSNTFVDNLSDLYCAMGIGIKEKSIGYSETADFDLVGLIGFNGTVHLEGIADPDLTAGIKLKIGEPQAILSAGVTDIKAGLNAYAEGEACALGSCNNINITLPTPTMDNVGLLGEVIVPFKNFESEDYIEALFLNPSGKNVRYEDLGEMSPVIRMATSDIMINYKIDVNLTAFGLMCDENNICYPLCAYGYCRNICTPLTDFGLHSDCIWNAFDGTLYIDATDNLKWGVCTLAIYSPVDVHLYDSMSRHIGPNETSGIDLEIPYSTYIVNGSLKTVTFPTTTDKFILILNGTDAGTYNMTVHRPILISDVNNNTDIIKGITYRVDNVPTNTGNIDYYNINFDVIEKQVNEKVHRGENITDAINDAFDLIISEENVTKLPTSLFVPDAHGANGDYVVLDAKLISLETPLDNRTIILKIDDNVVGQAITDTNGNGTLNYTIPENMDIGNHQISAIYSGDSTYTSIEGYASLNILNKPPEVQLDMPSYILNGSFLINGTIIDANLEQVILKIDTISVADSIPYLWNTTNYTNGLHLIQLTAMDSFGEKGQSMAFVIVDNSLPVFELKEGWNLISVPLNLTTWQLGEESVVGDPLNVTPKNSLTSIYGYNTTSGLFEKCDHFGDWGWWQATGSESFTELEMGKGYWVWAKTDCNLTFTGTEAYDINVTVDTGWNLIGWYSLEEALLGQESVVGNPLNVTPTNSLTSIYRYNSSTGLFEKCDYLNDWGWWPATGSESFTDLEPGSGYWVWAEDACMWRHVV